MTEWLHSRSHGHGHGLWLGQTNSKVKEVSNFLGSSTTDLFNISLYSIAMFTGRNNQGVDL